MVRTKISALLVATCFIAGALVFGDALLMPPPNQVKAWACASPCIQLASNSNAGAGATLDVTWGSNITSGSTIHCATTFCRSSACDNDTTAFTMDVSDTRSSTYTNTQDNTSYTGGAVRLMDYGAQNVSAGANVTHFALTTGGGEVHYLSSACEEWSATATSIDASGKGHNTSTTPSATSGVTADATEIVIGSYSAGNTATEGSGFARLNHDIGLLLLSTEYKTVAATGAQTANWTISSSEWLATVLTLDYTPAGGTVAGKSLLLGVQ